MDEPTRRRIEEYVRPLAVGLDGMTYYGDIERVIVASRRIAAERSSVDHDLLYLLAAFSGQEKWVERMGNASRTEIFLASLGVEDRRIRALLRGLPRLAYAPRTPEEEIVHDAVRLDELGAYGIARLLQEGYRERMDFLEMAAAIERAAQAPLKTEQAEVLATQRRRTMGEFARRLREECAEFTGSTVLHPPAGSGP